MKLLPLFLSAMIVSAAAAKAPVKFAELKLEDGTVLKEVEVVKVEPDAIRVLHSEGAHRVKMENLPEAVQQQFEFSVEKAVEFRAKLAAEKEKLDQAEHDAKVARLLEQRREDQEADVTRGREAFYQLMESDEYSYPRLDASLMETVTVLKAAGRDDLAAMVEEDRKLLREREIVRPGEKHRKEREQLQARIRDLENQVAQLSNRPQDVRVIRDVETVPVWVDRPVIVNPTVPYCPPVVQPQPRPQVPTTPVTLPSSGAQVQGAHLWKK